MPKISVIVPVYKVEQYLCECIESILAQTFADFELILIDDGSPDNCGAICDGYAERDKRITVIHKENGGLSSARNAGLDIARGEYVTFVDSDDAIHERYCELLLDTVKQTGSDIAICRFTRSYDDFYSKVFQQDAEKACSRLTGRDACYALQGSDAVTYTISCAKLVSTALFDNIRFPLNKTHEDEFVTYKLLYCAKLVSVIPHELYFYRHNPNGIIESAYNLRRFECFEAFKERVEFYTQHDEMELARLTECYIPEAMARCNIRAHQAGFLNEVPLEYRMPISRALRLIRKRSSDDNYTYYLAMVHPNWLRPHAYLRKLKKMLGIKCK